MRFDIVIVGAGIGGAVLALDLGRRGWRVALVERESEPPRIARPEILWGATLRALEPYGVTTSIRQTASVQLEEIELGGEKPWLRVTRDDLNAAGVLAFSTNPSVPCHPGGCRRCDRERRDPPRRRCRGSAP